MNGFCLSCSVVPTLLLSLLDRLENANSRVDIAGLGLRRNVSFNHCGRFRLARAFFARRSLFWPRRAVAVFVMLLWAGCAFLWPASSHTGTQSALSVPEVLPGGP